MNSVRWVSFLLILCLSTAASAQVRFPRHPAPSPDGSQIAFCYQGDIWIVPAEGGVARRVTAHPAYDAYPLWSPDGTLIAFASNRNGNEDIFVIPVESGALRQLTYHSGSDIPTDWTPDGKDLIIETRRDLRDGWNRALYQISLEGGTPFPFLSTGGEQGVLSPDATKFAYVRGSVSWWRRGYEGNARYRIWLHEIGTDQFHNLTMTAPEGEEPGINAHPAWFPDGEHILYLSESKGISNLKILSISSGDRLFLTRFQEGRLRFPRLADNGSLAAFEYEDGIYTLPVPAEFPPPGSSSWSQEPEEPRRLNIAIPSDRVEPDELRLNVSSNAEEFVISPDGRQIAFVYRGDIFAMKSGEEEPWSLRLTNSPARDYQIQWTPDSEGIIFVSDEAGCRDIYLMRSTDELDPRLARSLHREIKRLTSGAEEKWDPKPSPDGEWIAYIHGNGTLMTMRKDGSNQKTIVEGWSTLEYEWSPDGKWFVFSRDDNEDNEDVWIVAADGKEGPYNISQHPDNDGSATWSPDGRIIAFSSRRDYTNQADIWYVWLSREDEEKSKEDILDEEDLKKIIEGNGADSGEERENKKDKKEKRETPEIRIDFKGIHKRLHRVTRFPSEESRVLVSKDGRSFFFTSDSGGENDLWKISWDGTDKKRLTSGGQNPRNLQWGPEKQQIYYLKEGGGIASISSSGGDPKSFPYNGNMTVNIRAERAQLFDEAWRRLRDVFYDPDFHGADWSAAREKYKPWALDASTSEDLFDIIRMMLGELNGSHLQIYPNSQNGTGVETGSLGVIFDPDYEGPGYKILHVVPETPADRRSSRLFPGDMILSINGEDIRPGDNIWKKLEGTTQKKTLLVVARSAGGEEEVVIRPDSFREFRSSLYKEEMEDRRRYVGEAGGSRVAYIHIGAMSVEDLEVLERDLYAEAHGKDGLIIDVRDNVGGWITDMLLTILLAGDHATTYSREGGPGYPQGRRVLSAWTKPLVVLCNEFSFSNAEIFSWSIRTLGRGKVVGQQTYGGVISTGATTLIDGSRLRLPGRGWISKLDGSNMERVGCTPDIVVENRPDALQRGVDQQLEVAVQLALQEIEAAGSK
ncbi:MAG: hypothetical protein KJ970_16635 [Candidatus Eisenbacteria bacterium]|uniref:Tricorn protease homolog n=1 Tax=Eiseniibacteriota bacterium TaxID=2212470 RepID=A0A948WE88_UNCEI|nr:hypothetical protein [Candidatus Eisenbacteria bacterium]MBU1949631.1 hypothetical protein [Candidatus Eisenbacteria bacterium]MBU2692543.1 hypothetical protein [Candidatus Eisenbacteria bacterium]